MSKMDVQKMGDDKKIAKELEPGGNSTLIQNTSLCQ